MKFFKTLFWFALLLAPVALVFALLQSIEKKPLIAESNPLTAPRIERAKALLREHDPRHLKDQETKTISVSAQELSLVVNHLIQRLGRGGAHVILDQDMIAMQATVPIPGVTIPYYFNVDSVLSVADNSMSFKRLKIGKLTVPNKIANTLGDLVLMHAYRSVDIPSSNDFIKAMDVSATRLAITYQWQQTLIDAVRQRLISPKTVVRLQQYNDALVAFGQQASGEQSLAQLTTYLISAVRPDTDPLADNRAFILSLSNYVNGRRMSALIPEVKQWPLPKRVKITAYGRKDLAQHFATSAALAITGGSEISDAIGLYKEIDDSDGGSGFSFKDLAADRAGTQLGQIMTTTAEQAKDIRHRLGQDLRIEDLIPDLQGLEENMPEATFKARYGSIEDRRYLDVVADIDRRIAASSLFKDAIP